MATYDTKVSSSQGTPSQSRTGQAAAKSVSAASSRSMPGGTSSFEKGQVLKGEIIDLRDRDVKVQLNDSRIITAHLDSGTALSIGDRASFQVTELSLTSMSLKILSEGAVLNKEFMVDKALEEAGLPHTERNITAVRELLENQMSINKASIQNLLKQAATYKNASINTLALMNKYQIPITDISASQFEAYRNYEHRIVMQLSDLTSSLLLAMEEGDNNSLFINHILSLITKPETQNDSFAPFTGDLPTKPADFKVSSLLSALEPPSAQSLNEPIGHFLSTDSLLSLTELLDQHKLPDDLKVRILSGNASLDETAGQIIEAAVNENDALYHSTSTELAASLPDNLARPEVYTILEQYHSVLNETTALGTVLNRSSLDGLSRQLSTLDFPNEMIRAIKNGTLPGDKLINEIKEHSALPLLKSPFITSVIKELLTVHWTLQPKELIKPHTVETYYERLDRELSDLLSRSDQRASSDSGSDASRRQFRETAENIRDNINFMKTLNQIFTYVQLPVHLPGKNIHSELYVYTKKNKLKQDKNNIRVLLHLDMDQLGPLDVHLELNGSHVHAKFYIEDITSAPVLNNNMNLLDAALTKKGYSLHSEVVKQEKKTDIVKDFIAPEELDLGMKRYTFDIRA